MDMVTPITDHVEQATSLMRGVLNNKDNFRKIIELIVEQTQEIEGVSVQVMNLDDLDAAQGVQVDGLGQFYGIERNGDTDDNYKQRIRTGVLANQGAGSYEDLISAIRLSLPETNYVSFQFIYPKTVEITIDVADQDLITNKEIIKRSIDDTKQLGGEIKIKIATEGRGFRFAPDPLVSSEGRGFAGDVPNEGGFLAEGIK